MRLTYFPTSLHIPFFPSLASFLKFLASPYYGLSGIRPLVTDISLPQNLLFYQHHLSYTPDKRNDKVQGSLITRDPPKNTTKLILELKGEVCLKNQEFYNSLILLVVHFYLDRGNIGCSPSYALLSCSFIARTLLVIQF